MLLRLRRVELPPSSPDEAHEFRVRHGRAVRVLVKRVDDDLLALGPRHILEGGAEAEKLVIDAFDKDPEGATVSYSEFVGFVARARGQLDAAEA